MKNKFLRDKNSHLSYVKSVTNDCTNECDKFVIIIIIITQIYNARNVIITILKHHKMNLRRGSKTKKSK